MKQIQTNGMLMPRNSEKGVIKGILMLVFFGAIIFGLLIASDHSDEFYSNTLICDENHTTCIFPK